MKGHRPSDAELRVLAASMSIADLARMLAVGYDTVRVWLREAAIGIGDEGREPPPKGDGLWRNRLDEALGKAMDTIIEALTMQVSEPKDKIAQAALALKAFPALTEARMHPSSSAPAIVDRAGLLAKAKEASKGASRLRLVGS